MATLKRFIPLLVSLQDYSRDAFRSDLAAALTVAVMLIPQGMAYAMLAGLPPIIGLYASTVPLVLYALFGTSRQLAVGPVAMVSLLVSAGVGAIAPAGSSEYIGLALLLAAMVGLLQLVMGLARLGFLVNFLSHPVVSGFTSAAAIAIGLSQLKHLLGIPMPSSHHVHTIVLSAVRQLGRIDIPTLAIGVGSIALLVLLKRWRPRFPAALAVVVVATVTVSILGLHEQGVAIVGDVPRGLPAPSFPALEWASVSELFPVALTIAFVGFMESISVGKAFARKNRYDIDANRELTGLGLANIGAAIFQGYPVTGGFSRTAVNADAGARTGLASLMTAAIIGITLMFLTPLFYFLPQAVLAAIIMVAVFGLIDVKEVRHLYHVKRSDLAMLAVTFAGTLLLGIKEGILLGVGVSMGALIYRTMRPHVAVLGRVPGTTEYRKLQHYSDSETFDGILAIRIDSQLFFGNASFLKDTLAREAGNAGYPVRAFVIDASAISSIDSSADSTLREIVEDYRGQDIDVYIANVRRPVFDVMQRSGFDQVLGLERFTLSVDDAVMAAQASLRERQARQEKGAAVKGEDDETDSGTRRPLTPGFAA